MLRLLLCCYVVASIVRASEKKGDRAREADRGPAYICHKDLNTALMSDSNKAAFIKIQEPSTGK